MKKIILLFIAGIVFIQGATACDICGCGVGSYYIGILPEFSKKIVGIRYRYNTLRTHIGAGGQTTYLTTTETYQTAEVWGGWTIGKRFRAMAYLPLNFNEKTSEGATHTKSGLGDIAVQGFYQVFDQRKSVKEKLLLHSLWLGAGIKLPTGNYQAPEKNGANPSANIFQLGTGSVDFMLNGMYDIRLQDAGINTFVSYKVNMANNEAYRYGNKLSANMQFYYKFRIKQKVTLAPNAGVLYERAGQDVDQGYSVDVSGGHACLATAGVETAFKRLALGASFQHPFSQNLANGFVKANNRAMLHLSFIF